MSNDLYHGSITPGITALEARSQLHGTDKMVVYLTDSIPYALFYVWDSTRHGYSGKYITGGFRDGLAFYEEQFPDQLRTFYQGVSGYLYHIRCTEKVQPVANRAGLFYQEASALIADTEYIPDVYEALLQREAAGQLHVLRYNAQTAARKTELTAMIATYIRGSDFFETDPELAERLLNVVHEFNRPVLGRRRPAPPRPPAPQEKK